MVVVGAGAKLADVDSKTVPHSLVTPLGSYSQLGVAGFTLLGGTGFLSRSYGCAADNAVEFGKPAVSKFDSVFDENMRLSFAKNKFKIFFEKFVSFYVNGYTFMPSTCNVFQFIIPFPFISWLKKGRAGKGCNVKK